MSSVCRWRWWSTIAKTIKVKRLRLQLLFVQRNRFTFIVFAIVDHHRHRQTLDIADVEVRMLTDRIMPARPPAPPRPAARRPTHAGMTRLTMSRRELVGVLLAAAVLVVWPALFCPLAF
jgi:hypothetical protein